MLLTRIHSSGLAADVSLEDLDATSSMGPRPVATADALTLWCAALRPELGLADLGADLPDTAWSDDAFHPLHAAAWRAVFAHGGREATVEVSVAPDPPLYGRLREHAMRDPRLVSALGQEAQLHVKVGWRWPQDLGSASPDLLGARIGDVAFPIAGSEVPHWLRPLLADLASRVHRVDLEEPWAQVVARLQAAALAPSPAPRAAFERLAAALVTFGLPRLQLVLGTRLAFGDDLLDARLLGRTARDLVRVAEATLLRAPDILVVPDALSAEALAWVHARTDGDDATLEQALLP